MSDKNQSKKEGKYPGLEGIFQTEEFVPGKTLIKTGFAIYGQKEVDAVVNSLNSGALGSSVITGKFENEFAKVMGSKYASATNSGSSASLLATYSAKEKFGLREGDEIITPAVGFPTTVNPLVHAGLIPNFVDIDNSYNIDINSMKNAINKRTRGIFFAHTLGNPAKMDDVMQIAEENNLFVIEDCCDAYDGKYDGKPVGSFGDLATASFYPAHHITLGGEGGAVTTNDSSIDKIVKSFRDWGRDCYCFPGEDNTCGKRFEYFLSNGQNYDHKYLFSRLGFNLKVTEMQSAMGLVQLDRMDTFSQKRRENFNYYMEKFDEFGNFFEFPLIHEKADPVFFGFPMVIKDSNISRKNIIEYLNHYKIGTRYVFGGNLIHQPAYQGVDLKVTGDLKRSNEVEKSSFWLGLHPGMGEPEIDYITDKLKAYLKNFDGFKE
jgi:CDP-4-dehydro-6-deoxyglucose reductase, E1